MAAEYHGISFDAYGSNDVARTAAERLSAFDLSVMAASIGLRAKCVSASMDYLLEDAPLPCIAHWNGDHFVVVYKATKNRIHVADPAFGKVSYGLEEFRSRWEARGTDSGYAILLEPISSFSTEAATKPPKAKLLSALSYLRPYRQLVVQLLLGLLLCSLFQLALPFVTQAVVDKGIRSPSLSVLQLLLLGQIALVAGRAFVEYLHGWLILHISARVNVALVYDFLAKLMTLPIGFFEGKTIGDILQRVNDNQRIEYFVTTALPDLFLFAVDILIFSAVLGFYDSRILLIFALGTAIYLAWNLFFLKKRRKIDYVKFGLMSENQSKLIQMVRGMQELKLNNGEPKKMKSWARTQAQLFKVNLASLSLVQNRQLGSILLKETQNAIVIFYSAWAVMRGDMTLGALLAVQFIIGQLGGPVDQLAFYITMIQDAQLGLERIGEIRRKRGEDELDRDRPCGATPDASIVAQDLAFRYDGSRNERIIDGVSFTIPKNKTTAIVGASGSGKTTLIKLLLGIYEPLSGEVRIGGTRLQDISVKAWRRSCGEVMQDGFLFSDTIAGNIALGDGPTDEARIRRAAQVANIADYIEALPLAYRTRIGSEGLGLSQGQRQRILIARAVYKYPHYVFLDEATNSLDANNERIIGENLASFFKGRTVILVAHRLSTVKDADQIIVLEAGRVAEVGTHRSLVEKGGAYFTLFRNQLDLEYRHEKS
jgi:ATP-binding cassette, subfamily B, bacterial